LVTIFDKTSDAEM